MRYLRMAGDEPIGLIVKIIMNKIYSKCDMMIIKVFELSYLIVLTFAFVYLSIFVVLEINCFSN